MAPVCLNLSKTAYTVLFRRKKKDISGVPFILDDITVPFLSIKIHYLSRLVLYLVRTFWQWKMCRAVLIQEEHLSHGTGQFPAQGSTKDAEDTFRGWPFVYEGQSPALLWLPAFHKSLGNKEKAQLCYNSSKKESAPGFVI